MAVVRPFSAFWYSCTSFLQSSLTTESTTTGPPSSSLICFSDGPSSVGSGPWSVQSGIQGRDQSSTVLLPVKTGAHARLRRNDHAQRKGLPVLRKRFGVRKQFCGNAERLPSSEGNDRRCSLTTGGPCFTSSGKKRPKFICVETRTGLGYRISRARPGKAFRDYLGNRCPIRARNGVDIVRMVAFAVTKAWIDDQRAIAPDTIRRAVIDQPQRE